MTMSESEEQNNKVVLLAPTSATTSSSESEDARASSSAPAPHTESPAPAPKSDSCVDKVDLDGVDESNNDAAKANVITILDSIGLDYGVDWQDTWPALKARD